MTTRATTRSQTARKRHEQAASRKQQQKEQEEQQEEQERQVLDSEASDESEGYDKKGSREICSSLKSSLMSFLAQTDWKFVT